MSRAMSNYNKTYLYLQLGQRGVNLDSLPIALFISVPLWVSYRFELFGADGQSASHGVSDVFDCRIQ